MASITTSGPNIFEISYPLARRDSFIIMVRAVRRKKGFWQQGEYNNRSSISHEKFYE